MNKVFLQLWEESNINDGFLSNGCSLHLSSSHRDKYVRFVYSKRDNQVPEEYDRIVGEAIEVFISDEIYEMLLRDGGDIKLPESAFQNLLKFEDIVYNRSNI